MNGSNCQNCANSPWVQRANQFIVNNRSNPDYGAHLATIEFLLRNGHCGINNRIGIGAILQYLYQQGFTYSREGFQNNVLTELKRRGIVATLVYPGPQGGVFIPCNQTEIREVSRQLLSRVVQELTNLEGTANHTRIHRRIQQLRQAAERTLQRI